MTMTEVGKPRERLRVNRRTLHTTTEQTRERRFLQIARGFVNFAPGPQRRVMAFSASGGGKEPPTGGIEMYESDPFGTARERLSRHLRYTPPDSAKFEGMINEAKKRELQKLRDKCYKERRVAEAKAIESELGTIYNYFFAIDHRLETSLLEFFQFSGTYDAYVTAAWESQGKQTSPRVGRNIDEDTEIDAARAFQRDLGQIITSKRETIQIDAGTSLQQRYGNAREQLILYLGGYWTPNQLELEWAQIRLRLEKAENIRSKSTIRNEGKPKKRKERMADAKKGKTERSVYNEWLWIKHKRDSYYQMKWQTEDLFSLYSAAARASIPPSDNQEVDNARIHDEATRAYEKDLIPLVRSNRVVRIAVKSITPKT